MEGSMPVGNNSTVAKPGSRLRELGLVLPKPPSPLGAYVEASRVGSLLFLSGTLPLVNRKLAISGRLGANLSVDQGREAARLAALNALAAAQEHVRVVYGVHSAPIGAPVMVETVFEIESPQLEAQEETHE